MEIPFLLEQFSPISPPEIPAVVVFFTTDISIDDSRYTDQVNTSNLCVCLRVYPTYAFIPVRFVELAKCREKNTYFFL